ncbi:hypothetical protein EYR36_012027 [Pleurotus pulmonarius]|nr:hypothetical protein EYR36_012027 [Pleurotus pulmonarius]
MVGFLTNALVLEESQHHITQEASGKDLTPLQASQLQECRLNLTKQIKRLRISQRMYMLVVETLIANTAPQCGQHGVEQVKLWLPSALDTRVRQAGCIQGLAVKEELLREAQCYDALKSIRLNQRAKRHVIIHKKKSAPGQRNGTRARSSFDRLDSKINQAVQKYRAAHTALRRLRANSEWCASLPTLRDQDICPPPAFDIDNSGSVRSMKEAATRLGEGHRELSWIWRTATISGDGEDALLNEVVALKDKLPSFLLVDTGESLVPPISSTGDKSDRGWNHPATAHLLCPIELDPCSETINSIKDGAIIVDAEQLPRFLYPHDYTLDDDDMFHDIFRGYLMLRLHFALTSKSTWSIRDGPFDYQRFYCNILSIFEADPEAGPEIIDHYNYHLWGDKAGKQLVDQTADNVGTAPTTKESAFARLRAQRAAKHARLGVKSS